MSKEMKIVEQHELLSAAIQMAKNISNIDCLQKGGKPSDHWGRVLLDELSRLAEENAALREALRLKEAECEALDADKALLFEHLENCAGELKAWGAEYKDSESEPLIEELEVLLDEMAGDIQSANYYCQCENPSCGAWYQMGKEGDTCKECKTGKLTPQQVEEY